jgi:phosphoglycerate dehydrogenase-like enzyme
MDISVIIWAVRGQSEKTMVVSIGKVVLWRPMYYPQGHHMLAEAGADVVIVDSSNADEIKQALHGARALWVRTPERVTAEILRSGSELVVVSTSGFGTDNIDIPAATESGILVVNHQGFGRVPVSEHTIMMMLATAKQLMWGDRGVRDGSAWRNRSGLQISELEGKTVGIVGLGYIGSEIARKLKYGFNCRVIAYDPDVDPRIARLVDAQLMRNLYALLPESQFLVLVPELTPDACGMIGANELAALPKGAIVINTGRGRVLDFDALNDALESGHLFAAGVDAYFPEPLPAEHPLLRNQKVTFSPHIAGTTVEASLQLARSAADQILTALSGLLPAFPINKAAWEGSQSRRPSRV